MRSIHVMVKLFPDPFLKNQNWALWINSVKIYTVYFYCTSSWGLSKYIKTKMQSNCFYLIKSFFKKQKRSGTSLPDSFSAWFLKKNIYLVIFYYLTNFHCLVVFTSWDIEQYVYCLIAKNNIRIVVLEIKTIDVKSLKYSYFILFPEKETLKMFSGKRTKIISITTHLMLLFTIISFIISLT